MLCDPALLIREREDIGRVLERAAFAASARGAVESSISEPSPPHGPVLLCRLGSYGNAAALGRRLVFVPPDRWPDSERCGGRLPIS